MYYKTLIPTPTPTPTPAPTHHTPHRFELMIRPLVRYYYHFYLCFAVEPILPAVALCHPSMCCSMTNIIRLRNQHSVGTRQFPLRAMENAYSSMPELTSSTKEKVETVHFAEYSDEMVRNYFMDLALQQAQVAKEKGEVPIGAVIVGCFDDVTITTDGYTSQSQVEKYENQTTFQILSKAHNLVETSMDASAHAELLALRKGARNLKNWRYPPSCTLYSTLEPCPICLSSIQAFRIDNVVYGAPDHRLGAVSSHMDLLSIAKHPFHEIKSVIGGVREDVCGNILIDFFRERRKTAKCVKKTVSDGSL